MPWIIFATLFVIAAAGLVNEFAFAGKLFPAVAVAWASAFAVLAVVIGMTAIGHYRHALGLAAKHAAIWAVIVAVVVGAYWALKIRHG